jgi:CRISPR-associated exonuclease Cas4
MHEKVHDGPSETQQGVRIARGIAIHSSELGLSGKTDVVEFHKMPDGKWQPFPVEYKRGKPKADNCDKVQLCAQAICLEEMLKAPVPKGAIFYGKTRRRLDVEFDAALRQETAEIARQAHEFIDAGVTPPPAYSKKCELCSLIGECLPKVVGKKKSVEKYLKEIIGRRDIENTEVGVSVRSVPLWQRNS